MQRMHGKLLPAIACYCRNSCSPMFYINTEIYHQRNNQRIIFFPPPPPPRLSLSHLIILHMFNLYIYKEFSFIFVTQISNEISKNLVYKTIRKRRNSFKIGRKAYTHALHIVTNELWMSTWWIGPQCRSSSRCATLTKIDSKKAAPKNVCPFPRIPVFIYIHIHVHNILMTLRP